MDKDQLKAHFKNDYAFKNLKEADKIKRFDEVSKRNIKFKDVMDEFNKNHPVIGVYSAKSVATCIRKSFKPDGSYNILSGVINLK